MEELDRKGAALRPKGMIRLEPDLLIGVIVDFLEDVGKADRRLQIGARRREPRLLAQPIEIERLGRAEVRSLRSHGIADPGHAEPMKGGKGESAGEEPSTIGLESHAISYLGRVVG